MSTISLHLHLMYLLSPDSSDQLRLDRPGAQRQQPLRLLLAGGSSGLVPGSGHGGHRQGPRLELRLYAGLRGQLRRERRGRIPSDLSRGRYSNAHSRKISVNSINTTSVMLI